MNEYVNEELLPQVAERLEYTNKTLSKVKKLHQKPLRENITHHFKESNFWDYWEKNRSCCGYHYFNVNIEKFINKPLKDLIANCRNHPLYTKHKGFKRQVNEKISDLMKGPVMCERYSGSNFWEEEFVDYDGIIRKIEDHPLYCKIPHRERIAWRNWQNPNHITTTSRKCILKDSEGIHTFVPTFNPPPKDILVFNKVGKAFLKRNPDYDNYLKECVPLTKSQLQLYGLNNTAPYKD